jgi:hypothetical protein
MSQTRQIVSRPTLTSTLLPTHYSSEPTHCNKTRPGLSYGMHSQAQVPAYDIAEQPSLTRYFDCLQTHLECHGPQPSNGPLRRGGRHTRPFPRSLEVIIAMGAPVLGVLELGLPCTSTWQLGRTNLLSHLCRGGGLKHHAMNKNEARLRETNAWSK